MDSENKIHYQIQWHGPYGLEVIEDDYYTKSYANYLRTEYSLAYGGGVKLVREGQKGFIVF